MELSIITIEDFPSVESTHKLNKSNAFDINGIMSMDLCSLAIKS